MSKAPSKAPSRAPGVPSTAAHPSKVPLPPTQAPMSAHPSASTGSQVPSRMPSIVPRIEVVSPSQVPIPASVVPLPSLTPSAAAARLPSKTPLPSRVPASVRPPTITPSSRIPGQGHSVASSAVPRVSTYASFRGPPPSLPAITETTPSSHRASAAPGPAVSSSSSSSYFLSPSVIPREVATAATFATAIPPSSTIPAGAGAGGPTLKSVYRNPEDLRRAQMQTTYNTLTPAERADQDAWATHKADEFAPCPFNFAWERDDHYPGYRCAGGAHYMSDMILAEGVPGLYARQGCHRGLKNWDRKPAELENVPPGMYGPVRPVGVDRKGKYTYFEGSVDGPLTLKRSRTEPVFDRW